jgi:hypothetical protein
LEWESFDEAALVDDGCISPLMLVKRPPMPPPLLEMVTEVGVESKIVLVNSTVEFSGAEAMARLSAPLPVAAAICD